jgi:hypothetical protein
MRKTRISAAAGAALLALAAAGASAQQLNLPRPSPNAKVSQTIGVTEVSIQYSRPGVKGRTIWGDLVPYNEVWRTGANENTTITFNTPVKIGGKELPAGTYGLQTIPTTGDWTVILSKDADLWGAFNYKQEDDAVRLQATPRAAEFQERMGFEFDDLTDNSATVVMRWEKLAVPFKIEVDTSKAVMDQMKNAVRWQTPYQAANYCIQNNTCLAEASRYLDSSIALDANFTNQRAKALLLAKNSDWKGAAAYGDKALAAAKSAQQPPQASQVQDLEKQVAEWKKKG